jgi:ferric-dicitrate binding protein FerR (iron transport regulator)
MVWKKEELEQFLSYLEGNYTKEEERKLKAWLNSNLEHRKEFQAFRKIWETPDISYPKPDVEAALKNVMEKIGMSDEKEDIQSHFGPETKRYPPRMMLAHRRWTPVFLRAAAVIFLVLTPLILFRILGPGSMRTLFVESGRQEAIHFPDGSQVTLDAGSLLKYPKSFKGKNRTVTLNGEGYFKVVSNTEKPFVIKTDEAFVRVLGTEFNVRAWKKNESVVVAVAKGSVSLKSLKTDIHSEEAIISENQMSVLNKNEKPSQPRDVEIKEYLSWMQQEIYFRSTPLREVLDQLERWYNLEFILSDTSYSSNRITIFIEKKPIDEILELVCLVNRFTYNQTGNIITFSVKE